MIYIFVYRHGELEAEVEAESEEDALDLIICGDTAVSYTVNVEMLNPTMWNLADVLEED